MNSDNSLINIKGVTKSYRVGFRGKEFTAIRNVDLQVDPGESVGFIGHNGAGKSSTIRIIMGLQRATSGVAMLNGLSVADPDSRKGVAYVPENPLAYDYLTPREFLATGLAMAGFKPAMPRAHVMQWLERFGIAYAADKPLRNLSKGMVQRTVLAHALAMEPRLLVLDEPLSGLDPIGRAEVVDILHDYHKGGGALLFSSHILSDVERLGDRFVFIHKGSIRASYNVFDIMRGKDARQFEVVSEFRSDVDPGGGWNRLDAGVWATTVGEDVLAELLLSIQQQAGRVLSVNNVNTLERTYLRLVQEAEAVTAA